jgi:hypothetical protein
MTEEAINRLQQLCDTIPQLLFEIEEHEFSFKPRPEKWSKKEIIGHLIDSATNNHHRFIRAQFEHVPKIVYDQNKWNAAGFYQEMHSHQIISFWTAYNRQLIELIKRIPQHILMNEVDTGGESNRTLEFLITDYVSHLEHHLRQVVTF